MKACWNCDEPIDNLAECACMATTRIGGFLKSIPCSRRVGDYAHCFCRVIKAIQNRVWRKACSNSPREAKGALVVLMAKFVNDAAKIPAHSPFFMRTYRTLYLFSSIPTEHKNQGFKLDVKHVFKGWALRRPAFTRSGLAHLVSMNALDQKLLCLKAEELSGQGIPPQKLLSQGLLGSTSKKRKRR